MPLNTKTPQQFVSDCIAAFAAILNAAGIPYSPNLPSGDPFLALMQAKTAGGDMFLQAAAESCYTFARASTATGSDLDSWFADYGFTRGGATKADGDVTFTLGATSSQLVLIKPGTVVQTTTGIQYQVIRDTNQSDWNELQQAYVITPGDLTCDVTVQALVAGTASNVSIGALQQLVSSIPPVASVTNNAALDNGEDSESDAQARTRFILYFNSRARATSFAYIEMIDALGLNIQSISILENVNANSDQQFAYVTIVVDDGTGETPSQSIVTINAALPQVRACGIQVYIAAAAKLAATVNVNVKLGPNAIGNTSQVNVQNAIVNYINSLAIGQKLYWSKVIQIAQAADPNVMSVDFTSVRINGQQADLVPTARQVCRSAVNLVSVGTYAG